MSMPREIEGGLVQQAATLEEIRRGRPAGAASDRPVIDPGLVQEALSQGEIRLGARAALGGEG